jgi:hypothetical protein
MRAKAATRFGGFKLMDGSIVFSDTGAAPAAKVSINGYADRDGNLFPKPQVQNADMAVPPGLILSYTALLHYAARILPEPGQKDKVVFMELPEGASFPAFVKFTPDCRLVRQPPTAEGNSEFVLQQVYAGGNAEPKVTITIDKSGAVVESRIPGFTMRPKKPEPAPKPAPAKPAAAK